MENQNKNNFWKVATIVLLVALVAFGFYHFNAKSNSASASNAVAINNETQNNTVANENYTGTSTTNSSSFTEFLPSPVLKVQDDSDPLSLWTDSAPLKTELTNYINTITDENSPNFIPVNNRIATFDFDGTLFCETNPVYLDHRLVYHRIVEDETYRDKASEHEKETAAKIKDYMETGKSADNLLIDHGKCVASSFKGFTVDELYAYIKNYTNTPEEHYTNINKSEMYYQPMVQVVDYLRKNDFKVYVVSGTDRFLARAFVSNALNIPMRQVIGSDESLVATTQADTNGLDYQLKTTDKLVLGGDFIIKDLKMNKVTAIMREIGEKPVLAFGNTSGDFSMATYATSNNKYMSKAFMLCCDDTERENGNIDKANDMFKHCEEVGWTAVSMKNDFKTIYGDGVEYLGK